MKIRYNVKGLRVQCYRGKNISQTAETQEPEVPDNRKNSTIRKLQHSQGITSPDLSANQ